MREPRLVYGQGIRPEREDNSGYVMKCITPLPSGPASETHAKFLGNFTGRL